MKTTLVMRVSYKDVFAKSVSKNKLLECINIEHALEMLVLINKTEHVIKKSSQTELKFILNEWLINSNPEFKQSIIDCYLKFLNSNNLQFTKEFTEICIINRIGTLRTIEILLSQNNIKKNENIAEQLSMENLLKLYLIVNDEIAERQDVFFRRYRNGMDDKANEIRFHLFLGLSNADLTPKSLSKKLMAEVYKFALFEKWMKHRIKSKDVEKEFFKKVSSTDWYNFFSKIFQINNICINNYLISTKSYPELSVVLNYFSTHKQTDLEWNELTSLYKKPLHKNPNGDYLILDSEFMMNKFFSGTYHDLIEISKLHDKNFHLDYSKEFVEEGLFVKALK